MEIGKKLKNARVQSGMAQENVAEKMMEHLEESTNVVKSNQKVIGAMIVNMSESNSKELEKRKKAAGVGLLFLVTGIIGILCIVFL